MHGTYFASWDDTPYRQSVIALGDWVVFHAVPVGDVQGTLVQTHTFEWRRGDPWWSTYRRSVQVHAKNGPPGAFAEEVLGVARLLSVGGKPTGYAMPKREPPPEEDKY